MLHNQNDVDQEIEQIISKKMQRESTEEYEFDEGQDEQIHPDLIAAAEELGIDLNEEQMREL